jgi:hypothetical protein
MKAFFMLALLLDSPAVALEALAQPALSGTVAATTGGPLAGVDVEISPLLTDHEADVRLLHPDPEERPVVRARTDAAGRFVVRSPAAGLYRLVLQAPGRVPVERSPIPLVDDVELEPVSLATDAGLSVRVIDAKGHGVPDVLLIVRGAALPGGWGIRARRARTGADGIARVARPEGEILDLLLLAPGFAAIEKSGVSADLTVTLGPAERGREVALRARGAGGEPVPAALVRCGDPFWPLARTAADGTSALRLEVGRRTVCELSAADGREKAFAVEPGAPEVEVRLDAEPPVLTGRVRDAATGAPVAGALVWPPADPGQGARTGRDGSYRLIAPDAAAFGLRATAPGYLAGGTRVTRPEIRARRLPALTLRLAVALNGVVQSDRGAPLADVLVEASIGGADARNGLVADRRRTDAEGRFELRRLAGGRLYEVRAARPGFLGVGAEVALPALPRALPPLHLVLAPSRPARGTVLDETGKPLAEVRVVLRRASGIALAGRTPFRLPPPGERGTVETTTDARGRFAFPEVPAAEIDLLAGRDGFTPLLSRNRRIPAGAGPWDLGRVLLRRGVVLSGRVVDPAGRPVAQARVHRSAEMASLELLERILQDQKPDATTAADGRFTLTDLPAGKPVHLFVAAPRFLPGGAQGVRPPLTAPLTVRLQPGARLAGRILDEAGAPVAEAGVQLSRRTTSEGVPVGPPVYRQTTSDREGRFEIADAPAGETRVLVDAKGFVPWSSDTLSVPLPEGRELEVRLARGAVLQGSVRTTEGKVVAGARVSAGPAGARSDGEGFYRIEGVATGKVEVDLFHPNHPRQQRRMTIEPGTNSLDFEVAAGRRVAGRIVDDAGQPIGAAELALETPGWGHDHRIFRARSAADGLFELAEVPAGRYQLDAAARGYAPLRRKELVEVAAADVEDLVVTLGAAGAVEGRVGGLDEEQLSRVELRAEDEEGMELSRQGRVGPAGRFEVRDLAPGVWKLHAALASELREVTARVVITPGDTAQRDLIFNDRLALSGRVELDGEPLPEARVSVRAGSRTLERSVLTGYDGTFRLADLEPDTYWIGVSHQRQALTYNDTLELTADREIVLRLENGAFRGQVRDAATGKPLATAYAQLSPTAGAEFLVAGATDAAGQVLLPRVPPGTLRLRVSAEGYKADERTVEVAAGPTGETVEVELEPAAGLDLVVHLASGTVPAEVEVRAEAAGLAERRKVERDGHVRLPSLPAGTWNLAVTAPGGSPVRVVAQVPGPAVAVILPDAAPLQVEVPALLESDLIGSLRLADAAGRLLEIVSPAGQLGSQTALVAGRALVPAVPAGAWNLQAETPDGRRWSAVVTTDGRSSLVLRLE